MHFDIRMFLYVMASHVQNIIAFLFQIFHGDNHIIVRFLFELNFCELSRNFVWCVVKATRSMDFEGNLARFTTE